jgi:hypothetical protein
VTIALDEHVPAGPWDARITLHSGLLSRNARATITFPATGPSAASTRAGWLAAAIAALVLMLLAVATRVLVLRRRRRQPALTG